MNKFFCVFSSVLLFIICLFSFENKSFCIKKNILNDQKSAEEKEDKNTFNFIKLGVNSDQWLLYAGIILILISIIGIIFVSKPRKRKKIEDIRSN